MLVQRKDMRRRNLPMQQRRVRTQRQDARWTRLLMPGHRSTQERRHTPTASFNNWSKRALILPILASCFAIF
ncbi:hypothetical protein BKM25_10695 [Pseudomonas avellanae]|uniref:Uncharacterized protein n=1 Tax=Pseudomonas avellanae TaxID=46257 RepID=A0AAD0DXU1_9PSED|nr:hypothetical protein BKM03_13650 [Pseudomonas avellanae]PHN40941.1 hypothetical protein AO261_27875 [Pseudomonas avellanae]POD26424.1 hypothetical protein BKM05_11000 [Pseudomonas avellanae]POP84911.1 hypothetical protein CXB34_19945 [Pseudomonas amygdali pv. morsprunorum]POR78246.1 hypothetical protein BKM25_10695 [Pseudomonas avellanae]